MRGRSIRDEGGVVKKMLTREWVRFLCGGEDDVKDGQSAARRAGYGEDDLDRIMSGAKALVWWMPPELKAKIRDGADDKQVEEYLRVARVRKRKS